MSERINAKQMLSAINARIHQVPSSVYRRFEHITFEDVQMIINDFNNKEFSIEDFFISKGITKYPMLGALINIVRDFCAPSVVEEEEDPYEEEEEEEEKWEYGKINPSLLIAAMNNSDDDEEDERWKEWKPTN